MVSKNQHNKIKIIIKTKNFFTIFFGKLNKKSELGIQKKYTAYRVVEIEELEENSYHVTIQAINKNIFFKAKPEEILSDDNLVDLFSPRDIRTLTYLGYLGINSPKYKILAQRLSEKNDKTLFSLRKKRWGGINNKVCV